MALETGTYISDLVSTNPAGSDALAFADDHLRLIKSTLKNTFPNITGAVTATNENLNNGAPVGLICMWSNFSYSGVIPAGWALCNGQVVPKSDGSGNIGTPDLRDRFIVGTGLSYSYGNTGGLPANNLTVSQLPSHTHGVTDPGHAHSVSDPGHHHNISDPGHHHDVYYNGGSGGLNGFSGPVGSSTIKTNSGEMTTGIQILNTQTAIGINSGGTNVTIQNTGSGAAIENRPPYYALAFIMKV
jgi:microcystin-dependent protein